MATHDENRIVAAIMDLANQVARVAWALESQRIADTDDKGRPVYGLDPCPRCGSFLVLTREDNCSACLTPKKEAPDAGHRESAL